MATNAADETATFAVNLEDGTSGPAEAAAVALGNLQKKIVADTTALGQMQKALRNLKGATTPNVSQIAELSKRIEAQKQAIAGAQSSYLQLGGNFEASKKKARSFVERLGELGQTAKGLPGPVGGVVGQLQSLSGIVSRGALVGGLVAVAAVLVAVAVAAVAATAALLKFGISSANARRNEALHLESLTKMRNVFGLAAGNAKEMQASIDRVSGTTALGRDKLGEYTAELYKMGLRGKNLDSALEGMAIKGAVVGDEGAKAFGQWAAGAARAGKSVQRLTDDVKARFGGIAAAQLLDLDVQTKKLHESFAALFADLGIDKLLEGINSITALFSQSTRSGQALKAIMETVFQPLVDAITYVAPIAKRFFQGIIVGALLVSIAVLKLRRYFRETFGGGELISQAALMKTALLAGVAAVGLFAAAMLLAFGAIVAVLVFAAPFLWAAVAAVGALAVQGLILAAPFILAAVAVGALIAAGYQLYQLWKEIDWTSLGTAIVDGIVNGIKASAKWLTDTVNELGTGALDALKSTLGIASPSKAFAQLGIAIPQGVAAGIDAGKGDTQSAVDGLVGVPGAPRGQASGSVTIDVGGITINAGAGDQASDIAADVERELVPVFERIAIQLGAMLPRVPA
jgi:hypothetical protein